MTLDELLEMMDGSHKGKRNKYGAQRSGGYHSKKEHNRAKELRMMQSAGLISDLKEQVSFQLIPPQYNETGCCIEYACNYIADFVYTRDGKTVVEDTKGFRTKEYIIKRKLMLWLNGIRILEI